MPDYITKSLTDLKNEGKLLTTAIASNALFLLTQGSSSYVVRWDTIVALLTPPPAPVTSGGKITIDVAGVSSLTLPGGALLDKVKIKPTATGLLKIGTTSGGDDVLEFDIEAGEKLIIGIDDFDVEVDTTLYITSVAANVVLYYR